MKDCIDEKEIRKWMGEQWPNHLERMSRGDNVLHPREWKDYAIPFITDDFLNDGGSNECRDFIRKIIDEYANECLGIYEVNSELDRT